MNIAQHFFKAAELYPKAIAIVEKGKAYTYADFAKKVRQVSAYLKQQGYQKGDNILVVIPPSIELYVNLLAIFTIGARAVLVDNIFPRKRVLYAVKKADCKGVLTTPLLSILLFFFGNTVRKKLTRTNKSTETHADIANVAKNETALITFTSGTTGNPKAANRTHGFLNIQLQTIIEKTKLTAGDVHITSFPVVMLCNLAVGATSIIPPKNKEQHWQKINEAFKVNVVSASPYHFNIFQSKLKKENFEKVVIGGASIYADFVDTLKDQSYARAIQLVYGSTEAEPIATLTIDEYLQNNHPKEKGICVGSPHPNILVKIVDIKDDQLHKLNEASIGEIIVAGPHVLKTYYKDPEAYAKNKIEYDDKIWHRTGDAGYLKAGKLYFFGRMKHCWKEAGELLSTITLEKFVSEHRFNGEATWLNVNGEKIVFYVGDRKEFEDLLLKFPYEIDVVIQLKKLAKDKRHQSRIDYVQLISTLR